MRAWSRPSTEPAFDDLPVLPATGLRHAWDVFGRGDQLGTLNRLTNGVVSAAARGIESGRRISLTLPLELPDPPLFGRQAVEHAVFATGRNSWDDRLDRFFPQASTQWDSLRHIRAREDGFYGGWQGEPDQDAETLGIHHWARQGIIGRGVLIDLVADIGEPYDPFVTRGFDVSDLVAALSRQSTTLRYGDIACIRTGWMDKYLALAKGGREELSTRFAEPRNRGWAGLLGSEEVSRFLWEAGLAAVVCDNPAVEMAPGDPAVGSLHRRLIPCLGFALGELFDLTELAVACQETDRWDFLFSSIPLPVTGGVGSPAAAMAIL